MREHSGRLLVRLEGVASRDAADALRGSLFIVDTAELPPIEDPDEFYDHQLVGLDVVREGATVGVIDRLEHLPAQDLLVVQVGDREVLVPFVRAIVPVVDLAAGHVVVTPPDGLFEMAEDEPRPPLLVVDGTHDIVADADPAAAAAPDESAEPSASLEADDTAYREPADTSGSASA